MTEPTPPQETLSVRIDADLHNRLKAAAFWHRRTKREVVEDALRAHLHDLESREGPQPIPDGAGLPRGRRPRPAS